MRRLFGKPPDPIIHYIKNADGTITTVHKSGKQVTWLPSEIEEEDAYNAKDDEE